MSRDRWLAEKRAEIAALAGLATADIVPSRRDFLQFVDTQKQSIALVPRVARVNPETGAAWPGLDAPAFARACDDADTAALAVRTAALHGGTISDLKEIAAAVTAPLLRDDLCLDRVQLYQARLYGADAVLLPAGDLELDTLVELAAIARSLHMAAVIEVSDEHGLAAARAVPTACVGLWCLGQDGFADLARAAALADHVGQRSTVVLLSDVRALADLLPLRGRIDAAVVGDALLAARDPGAAIDAFTAPPTA
jgi:indole-3-glycerol phosphate synthase